MFFTIGCQLDYRFEAPSEVLLLIEAARAPDQAVTGERLDITPHNDAVRVDDALTGERRIVFTAEGDVRVSYRANVEVIGRHVELGRVEQPAIRDLPADALRYLRSSRYCPSDRFEPFVDHEFGHLRGGEKVEAIVTWVRNHLEYRPGASDVRTTALDTFVDRAGVCRDFTHLTIALLRASDIPARAVSAYAWRLDPPDMHAVAEVYLGGRWRLIDPTGKAPIEGLVRVATGLDAVDIAFMTVFGRAELLSQSFSIDRQAEP